MPMSGRPRGTSEIVAFVSYDLAVWVGARPRSDADASLVYEQMMERMEAGEPQAEPSQASAPTSRRFFSDGRTSRTTQTRTRHGRTDHSWQTLSATPSTSRWCGAELRRLRLSRHDLPRSTDWFATTPSRRPCAPFRRRRQVVARGSAAIDLDPAGPRAAVPRSVCAVTRRRDRAP